MRPRLITAENTDQICAQYSARMSFNEAAAHHRGEHAPRGLRPPEPDASMRPRLITAENVCSARIQQRDPSRFNEAAAHHRGEPSGSICAHVAERTLLQ